MNPEITPACVCVPSRDVVAREIEGDLIIVPLVSGIGDADDEHGIPPATMDTLSDLAQFLALQFYLLGAIMFVAPLRWQSLTRQQSPMSLGDVARSMFSNQSLLHKYRYPRTWAIALLAGAQRTAEWRSRLLRRDLRLADQGLAETYRLAGTTE